MCVCKVLTLMEKNGIPLDDKDSDAVFAQLTMLDDGRYGTEARKQLDLTAKAVQSGPQVSRWEGWRVWD